MGMSFGKAKSGNLYSKLRRNLECKGLWNSFIEALTTCFSFMHQG